MAKKIKNPGVGSGGMKAGGRPKVGLDFEQLEIICQYPCSIEWAANFFKVSPNTIVNRVKQETGLNWTDFCQNCLAPTRFSLMQAAVDQAKAGNGKALAMCLKKFCEWDTKRAPEISINNITMSNDQLDAEILKTLKDLGMELKDGQEI